MDIEPRPVMPRPSNEELVRWLSQPELALWPHNVTVDQLMRWAAEIVAEQKAHLEQLEQHAMAEVR
ncbi:hypothetical protein ACFVAJ_16660 [Agromyces sp. NPDC057679]|uniref:hypothetical protein n=1 Tax=Agromyces sp. NPDC057679 TaxID=3346207 RepID=UPI00366D5252